MKKPSPQSLEKMLDELFEIMPELKKNKSDWKNFIVKFIESRPNDKIDAKFKRALHEEILGKIAQQKSAEKPSRRKNLWIGSLWFLGGAAVTAVAVVPMLDSPEILEMQKTETVADATPISAKNPAIFSGESEENLDEVAAVSLEKTMENLAVVNIAESADNAFGTVKKTASNAGISSDAAYGRGGGMRMESSIAPMPGLGGRTNVDYIFDGELPDFAEKINVFKKMSDATVRPSFKNQIEKLGMGRVDLTTFENLEIQNVSLAENVDELGFFMNVDFQTGSIDINANYEQWHPPCFGEACYQPIPMSELPEDRTIIRWAEIFLAEHKVSTENFGKPIIQKYWEHLKTSPLPEYVPETMRVVFPYLIGDDTAISQWGEPFGMNVQGNLKKERGSGLYLASLNLQSSRYTALSNEEVLEMAKTGGSDGVRYSNPQKTIEIKLINPEIKLTQITIWNDTGKMVEFFVPTLIFKTEIPENTQFYVPQQIVVPLAKDLFAN